LAFSPIGSNVSRLPIALALLAAASLAHAAASAVSPQRTTVIGGETQVFSARFTDAQGAPLAGQAVSFFNDACGTFNGGGFLAQATTDSNGVASINFTALNTGFIRCTVTAASSAGGSVSFDVVTFRADPRVVDIAWQTDPVEPRPGQPYRITASAKVGAFNLYNVDIAARVVAGSASASIPAATFNSGQDGSVQFNVTPDGRWGDYDVELSYLGKAVRAPMQLPVNPMQDLWWSGVADNGWGMSVVQHRDLLFSIIYAYDGAGKPTWYVMPSGAWNAAHTAFTGDVYLPKGAPYFAYDTARFDIGPSLGNATITFDGENSGSLDYSIRGVAGHKAITRLLFGQVRLEASGARRPVVGRPLAERLGILRAAAGRRPLHAVVHVRRKRRRDLVRDAGGRMERRSHVPRRPLSQRRLALARRELRRVAVPHERDRLVFGALQRGWRRELPVLDRGQPGRDVAPHTHSVLN